MWGVEEAFDKWTGAGEVICERLVNMPVQVVSLMHRMLITPLGLPHTDILGVTKTFLR